MRVLKHSLPLLLATILSSAISCQALAGGKDYHAFAGPSPLCDDVNLAQKPLDTSFMLNFPKEPNCKDVNLRSVSVGFKCRTSKGAIFERVSYPQFDRFGGESWKGTDGLIWSDILERDQPARAAADCYDLGANPPGYADIVAGGANGFSEVLPHLEDLFWVPSSACMPNRLVVYDNSTGSFLCTAIIPPPAHDSPFVKFSHASVRCVAKAQSDKPINENKQLTKVDQKSHLALLDCGRDPRTSESSEKSAKNNTDKNTKQSKARAGAIPAI